MQAGISHAGVRGDQLADPYLSEIKYRGGPSEDFIEVAVDAGTSVAGLLVHVYNPNGTLRSVNSVSTYSGTIAGKDVYLIQTGIHKNGAVALSQDGTLLSFVSFDNVVTARPGTGPAAGQDSVQIGSTGNNQNASLATNGDGNYGVQTPDAGVIPCFLRGTRIACHTGLKCVEDLEPGDLVRNHRGDWVPLRWVGAVEVSARGGAIDLVPVKIARGALGKDQPLRDMWVSPNHRILMTDPQYELYFDGSEVLIPAKHLVGWNGISFDQTVPRIVYYHLLFDEHQVILSEGLYSESLHPASAVLDGMQQTALDEVYHLFPHLKTTAEAYGSTARQCLKAYEAGVLKRLHG